ncbi:hypothetical protein [Coleofasciculus sp. LEGE 07081]
MGCGDGTWLLVFQEFGIQDYLGIDGNIPSPVSFVHLITGI